MWNHSIRLLFRRQSLSQITLESVQVQQPEQWLEPNDLIEQITMTYDVRHGSSETLPTRRRSMPLSDLLEWFDGLRVELELNPPMT